MILDGFDVEAYDLDGAAFEIAPGVMYHGWFGNEYARYAPAGHPDGRVGRFTVPPGVRAITFQMFGCIGGAVTIGGAYFRSPDDELPYQTPVYHTRRLEVTPGDEIVVAAGGPQLYGNYGVGIPTHGNGPIRGGWGGQDFEWVGGAGGGASALWINGVLVALSPGGGGWTTNYAGLHPPTDPSYPTGTPGAISVGTPTFGIAGRGGGGGGAPGGAGGSTIGFPGVNGAGVPIDADSGGPPSPTWAETTLGSGDYHGGAASAVRVFYYTPRSGGWAIDETRF